MTLQFVLAQLEELDPVMEEIQVKELEKLCEDAIKDRSRELDDCWYMEGQPSRAS